LTDWKQLRATKRTRFAPSPTGDLHLGGALCALVSRDLAFEAGAAFVVRMEDLDPPRVVAGAAERILDDLEWLGLGGDEGPRTGGPVGPYVQSARFSIYERALETLERAGRTYACDCSRAEIARVASAPHEGEDVIYPGTCRDKDPSREMRRSPAIRFRGGSATCDDFVLRRGDGVFSYQLAVSVDDLAMAIAVVVRGEDLRTSTPRQLALMDALGAAPGDVPSYVHLPLVRDASGARLSKRTAGGRVRALREGGLSAKEITDALAVGKDGTPFVVPRAWERFGV
jgi:glutamyl-tRNA synthetase